MNRWEKLKKDGFVKLDSELLVNSDVRELEVLAGKVFDNLDRNHPDYLCTNGGAEGILRFPQHSEKALFLINKILADYSVKSLLKNALGDNYKIWQINLRRASPKDQGLYLHQDAPGELGMCVMLSDNMSGDGSTIFLPGSHLWPKRMDEYQLVIPPFLVRLFKFALKTLRGGSGDVAIFFNRTWHGRTANNSEQVKYVILISFFGEDAKLKFEGYGKWSSEFINRYKHLDVVRLIDAEPSQTTTHIEAREREKNFTLDLEEIEKVQFSLLHIWIGLMRLVVFLGRFVLKISRLRGER